MAKFIVAALVVFCCGIAFAEPPASQPLTPLTKAHAHNDYEHEHPLFDALACGFCSVEADIHLVNGELLVAHDLKDVRPDRSLKRLYLDPLRERITANGGRVYRGGPTVVLLIDVKTSFVETYPVLRKVLGEYEKELTTWSGGKRRDGAIKVIVTGDRQWRVIAADEPRLCACDGDLAYLDADPPSEVVPWVSLNWSRDFTWKADGRPMPEAEKTKLRDLAARTHRQGRLLRFWGGPDNAAVWQEELADGVDILNTDRLKECETFLINRQ